MKKSRPTPIKCTNEPYESWSSSGSSPSSLSPSTTDMTCESDTDSQHSFSTTSSDMPLTRARLEHVLVKTEKQQRKRASTPSSAPANGIFKLGWWSDSNSTTDEESEDEYPPTPNVATPRTARFLAEQGTPISATWPRTPISARPPRTPVSGRPQTPLSARPVTPASARPRPRTPVSARPLTPASARPLTPVSAARPASARPLTPASSRPPLTAKPRTPLTATFQGQLALPQETPRAPKFRRRPTELKLQSSWTTTSSSDEELSTSPSSASESSIPPSPTDSLPPSPSQLTVPQYQPFVDSPHPASILSPASPSTPFSPSARFCARNASAKIKNVDGYVSFGAIEGLGMPDMDEDFQNHVELEPDHEAAPTPHSTGRVQVEKEKKDGSWTPRWLSRFKI